jgi:putative addiction module component (TIGR02574 family)
MTMNAGEVPVCPDEIELTPTTRKLLDKRLAAYRANPDLGSPWKEVKRRIVSNLSAYSSVPKS